MGTANIQVSLEIPEVYAPFQEHHRYKVASGGRGSAKSWTFGALLLVEGLRAPELILCAREIQNTIRDSVHELLSRTILRLGLSSKYTVTDREIVGHNGTKFIFKGLSHHVDEIKSMEGVTRCWIAQADNVSWKSWEVLIPTIRAPGSEIWLDFNPSQTDDATYDIFVTNRQPDEVYIHTTYRDNPWFPPELERERLYLLENNKAKHDHIYEGLPMLLTDARVFNATEANFYGDADLSTWIRTSGVHDVRITGGIDFGFEDADAFSVLLYSVSPRFREKWLIHEYKQRRESVTAFAGEIKKGLAAVEGLCGRLGIGNQLYICSDFGGGGKQIAWELYTQHGIRCFEAAVKGEKRLAVELLRDEVAEGLFRMPAGGPTHEEMTRAVWQRNEKDEIIREIDDDVYHPDALWATIYALRPVWARTGKLAGGPEAPMMEAQRRMLYGR